MTKKISNFIKNIKVYIIIAFTMIVIFLVSLLIIRNITKDKEDVKNEESNIVNVIQSDSMQEDSMSDVMEGDEDNLPVEPKFPGIEIPEIIE